MPGLSVGAVRGWIEINGVPAARQGQRDLQRDLDLTGTSLRRTGAAVEQTDKALLSSSKASTVAAEGSAKHRAALYGEVAAAERLTGVLSDETASVGRLASAERGLILAQERVRATSPERSLAASAAAAETAGSRMTTASSRFAEFAGTAAKLGLALGAFELARKAIEFVSAGKDLTESLNGVQAASHASAEQMKGVRTEAISLGKDMTVPAATAVDAADAINDLVRAGMKLPRAMEAARPALLLASAAQVDTADAARYLGDTLDDFRLPASEATRVANLLAGGATSAGGGLDAMFDAMKFAGPVARAAGVDVADVVTSITELAKSGIQGTLAGTGLRSMLLSLAGPTRLQKSAMQDLNVQAWDAHGNFVGLPKLFDQLHGAQERLTRQDFLGYVRKAFGKPAATVISTFAHGGAQAFDEFAEHVKKGDVQKYADLMNRGVAADFRQLTKQATAFGIDFYDGVQGGLDSALNLIGKALPEAIDIGKAALEPFGVAWHLVEAGLGPVIGMLGDALGALHPLLPVLKSVAGDALTVWAAFKGYTIIRYAMSLIGEAFDAVKAKSAAGLATVRTYGAGVQATLAGNASEAQLSSSIMQAEFDAVAQSALEEAAAIDRAAAGQAVAYADVVAASKSASDAQILAADEAAAAALAQAETSATAAAAIATSAEASATAVAESGEVASLGWAGLLGPLAAVGIGVTLLTGLFHGNDKAAQDNKATMSGYAQSLKQSSDALAAVNTEQTAKNLKDQGAIDLSRQLTASNTGLKVSYGDMVLAVNGTKAQYDGLEASLHRVAAANQTWGNTQVETNNATNRAIAVSDGLRTSISSSGELITKQATGYNKTGQAALDLAAKVKTLRASFTAEQKQQQLSQQIERQAQQIADGGASATARTAKSLGLTRNAYLDAQKAAHENTAQTRAQTAAFQAENNAMSLLQQALDRFAGNNLNVASAQTSLASANLQVAASFKQNGTAIDGNSQKAVNNQQAIEGQVQAANAYAEAIGKKTHSTEAEISALKSSKSAMESQLQAQGKLTPAVQAYINKLYNLNSVSSYLRAHPTKLDADTAAGQSKIQQLKTEMNNIRQGHVPGVDANTLEGQQRLAELQREIDALRGKSVTISVTEQHTEILNQVRGLGGERAATGRASGGAIHGDGTETSDSIPLWASDNEHMVSAREVRGAGGHAAVERQRAIWRGAARRAYGGPIQRAHGSYSAAGTEYQSFRAAFNAEMRLFVTVDDSDVHRFWKSLSKSAADAHSAFRDLIGDARDAGVGEGFRDAMWADERQLEHAIDVRNSAAGRLERASDRLAAWRKKESDQVSSIKSATRDAFDIATAGTDGSSDARPTAGSIYAQALQNATIDRRWSAGIITLGHRGLNHRDLTRLADDGPGSWPEVQALLADNPKQLGQLNSAETSIADSGQRVGAYIANLRYGGHVDKAESYVERDRRRLQHDKLLVRDIGGEIRDGVRDAMTGLELDVKLQAKQTARLVAKGNKRNDRRK